MFFAEAPVRFRNRLVDTEVKENGTAFFECTVSNREATPEWYINGQRISSTGRYELSMTFPDQTRSNQIRSDDNVELSLNFLDLLVLEHETPSVLPTTGMTIKTANASSTINAFEIGLVRSS